MRKNAATRQQFSSCGPASTTKAPTLNTTPRLIGLAVSLVGDQKKVVEQMRCSEADFLSYYTGQKELPFDELDRLVSLIIQEERSKIAKQRESLNAARDRRILGAGQRLNGNGPFPGKILNEAP